MQLRSNETYFKSFEAVLTSLRVFFRFPTKVCYYFSGLFFDIKVTCLWCIGHLELQCYFSTIIGLETPDLK